MNIAVIKYNAGNIRSVMHALDRLGIEGNLTDDMADLLTADKVIFPGVGEASSAMKYLKGQGLDKLIRNLKQPVLGICLGLQLLCKHSVENDTDGMGVFDLNVRKFPAGGKSGDKVPHMGWNAIYDLKGPLYKGVDEGAYVYFVHGYYAELGVSTCASCDYILPFSAGLKQSNFHGTQFHPEKSGDIGSGILENFVNLP